MDRCSDRNNRIKIRSFRDVTVLKNAKTIVEEESDGRRSIAPKVQGDARYSQVLKFQHLRNAERTAISASSRFTPG